MPPPILSYNKLQQQHEILGEISYQYKGETNSAHEGGKLRPCLLGLIFIDWHWGFIWHVLLIPESCHEGLGKWIHLTHRTENGGPQSLFLLQPRFPKEKKKQNEKDLFQTALSKCYSIKNVRGRIPTPLSPVSCSMWK